MGERDRLRDENEKLAADLGEEPKMCANTEDTEALVEQIKSLKGENDRLRKMQAATNAAGRKSRRNWASDSNRNKIFIHDHHTCFGYSFNPVFHSKQVKLLRYDDTTSTDHFDYCRLNL